MCSTDSSAFKNKIYSYLGLGKIGKSSSTDALIEQALEELKTLSRFVYRYEVFDFIPEFARKEPYLGYFGSAHGALVCVATLGHDVDRRIKVLTKTDAAMSVVLDACASAYIEKLADEYERALPYELSYRFCPGYGGSDISDIRYIFDILKPEKFGVTLNKNNYMLPSKTMAGIIAVGSGGRKSCDGCALGGKCRFTEAGEKCYTQRI